MDHYDPSTIIEKKSVMPDAMKKRPAAGRLEVDIDDQENVKRAVVVQTPVLSDLSPQ